jgi:hypothetical protein
MNFEDSLDNFIFKFDQLVMIKDSKRKDEESVSNEIDKCSNSTQLSKQTIKKNQAKTAGSHFAIAERICDKLGFDIHLRQGQ